MTSDTPTTSRSRAIEIDLQPDPSAWREALRSFTPSPAREQLGIPNDRPIVFSGHQPIVFHNGILAKLIAQHEIAQSTGAGRVWIVADQDVVDLETVRVPVGSGLELSTRDVRIMSEGSTPPGVPSASLPATEPVTPEDDRLHALAEYISGYAHESSLARQFANATLQLASDRLGIQPPHIIYASELFQCDALWEVVRDRLLPDPGVSVNAYNNAVSSHPDARVRELAIAHDTFELPLWGLREQLPRVGISTDNIQRFAREQLAPRGLFMSGLVRTHLGELFIHGTGGWRYDLITQEWMRRWLGTEPNPMALTTATTFLPLGISSDEAIDLKQAQWRFHHARHHPSLVGDHEAQQQRDAFVEQIESARSIGDDPDPIYQRLVSLLESHRVRNADELKNLSLQIDHAQTHATQIELVNDRTWAFPLFDDESLLTLRERIRAAIC